MDLFIFRFKFKSLICCFNIVFSSFKELKLSAYLFNNFKAVFFPFSGVVVKNDEDNLFFVLSFLLNIF